MKIQLNTHSLAYKIWQYTLAMVTLFVVVLPVGLMQILMGKRGGSSQSEGNQALDISPGPSLTLSWPASGYTFQPNLIDTDWLPRLSHMNPFYIMTSMLVSAINLHPQYPASTKIMFRLLNELLSLPLVWSQSMDKAHWPLLKMGELNTSTANIITNDPHVYLPMMNVTGFEIYEVKTNPNQPQFVGRYIESGAPSASHSILLVNANEKIAYLARNGLLTTVNLTSLEKPEKISRLNGLSVENMALSQNGHKLLLAGTTPTGPKFTLIDTESPSPQLRTSQVFPWFSASMSATQTQFSLQAIQNEQFLVSYRTSSLLNSWPIYFETALYLLGTQNNTLVIKGQYVSNDTLSSTAESFGSIASFTPSPQGSHLFMAVTSNLKILSAQKKGLPLGLNVLSMDLTAHNISSVFKPFRFFSYDSIERIYLLHNETLALSFNKEGQIMLINLPPLLGYPIYLQSISIPISQFDTTLLSKDKPTLIRQGNQYFLYGNTSAWKLTELDASMIPSSITFPPVDDSAQVLPYHPQYINTLYAAIQNQQAYQAPIVNNTDLIQAKWLSDPIEDMALYAGDTRFLMSRPGGIFSYFLSEQDLPAKPMLQKINELPLDGRVLLFNELKNQIIAISSADPQIQPVQVNLDSLKQPSFHYLPSVISNKRINSNYIKVHYSSDGNYFFIISSEDLRYFNNTNTSNIREIAVFSADATETLSAAVFNQNASTIYTVTSSNNLYVLDTKNITQGIRKFSLSLSVSDCIQIHNDTLFLAGVSGVAAYTINNNSTFSLLKFISAHFSSGLVYNNKTQQLHLLYLTNKYAILNTSTPSDMSFISTLTSPFSITQILVTQDGKTGILIFRGNVANEFQGIRVYDLSQAKPVEIFNFPSVDIVVNCALEEAVYLLACIINAKTSFFQINPSAYIPVALMNGQDFLKTPTMTRGQVNTGIISFYTNSFSTGKIIAEPRIETVSLVNDDQTLTLLPADTLANNRLNYFLPTSFTATNLTLELRFNSLFKQRITFHTEPSEPLSFTQTLAPVSTLAPTAQPVSSLPQSPAPLSSAPISPSPVSSSPESPAPTSTTGASAAPDSLGGGFTLPPEGQPLPPSNSPALTIQASTHPIYITSTAPEEVLIILKIGLAQPYIGTFILAPSSFSLGQFDAPSGILMLKGTVSELNEALSTLRFSLDNKQFAQSNMTIGVIINGDSKFTSTRSPLSLLKLNRAPVVTNQTLTNQTFARAEIYSFLLNVTEHVYDPDGDPLKFTLTADGMPLSTTSPFRFFPEEGNEIRGRSANEAIIYTEVKVADAYSLKAEKILYFWIIITYIAPMVQNEIANTTVKLGARTLLPLNPNTFNRFDLFYSARDGAGKALPSNFRFDPYRLELEVLSQTRGVLTYQIWGCDEYLCAKAIAFLMVNNYPPEVRHLLLPQIVKVLSPFTYELPEGTFVDRDDKLLSYTVESDLQVKLDGTKFSFTPAVSLAGTQTTVTFIADDGYDKARTNVTLIFPEIASPVIQERLDNLTFLIGGNTLSFSVARGFKHPDGYPLTYAIDLSGSLLGKLYLDPESGEIRAKPTEEDIGNQCFIVSAVDPQKKRAQQTFCINTQYPTTDKILSYINTGFIIFDVLLRIRDWPIIVNLFSGKKVIIPSPFTIDQEGNRKTKYKLPYSFTVIVTCYRPTNMKTEASYFLRIIATLFGFFSDYIYRCCTESDLAREKPDEAPWIIYNSDENTLNLKLKQLNKLENPYDIVVVITTLEGRRLSVIDLKAQNFLATKTVDSAPSSAISLLRRRHMQEIDDEMEKSVSVSGDSESDEGESVSNSQKPYIMPNFPSDPIIPTPPSPTGILKVHEPEEQMPLPLPIPKKQNTKTKPLTTISGVNGSSKRSLYTPPSRERNPISTTITPLAVLGHFGRSKSSSNAPPRRDTSLYDSRL